MKCPSCKHPIEMHSECGCYHEKKNGDLCSCLEEKGDVALALLPKLEAKIKKLEKQISDMQEMLLEEGQ